MTVWHDPAADQDTVILAPIGSAEVRADAAAAATNPAAPRRSRVLPDRYWFLIVFVLALAVFSLTAPGREIFDTKLGVDIRAGEFLGRLWSLWNPLEWFGSLSDQYVGYAIPMAPFFLIGQLLHVPVWLIERLWLALLVAVGFTGMVKLARALNIGGDASRLAAAAVFVLWPAFTMALGSTSAGALPGLMVPWAILPLIPAARGESRAWPAAARSGLAVALMGGVNATSTVAVLLLPALYLGTHARGRRRITLGLKWCVAVLAATLWWIVPLLLQGRYAVNFLPYIEQSGTTAQTMSAATLISGTGTWTAYLAVNGMPWITAGWTLVSSPAAILSTTAMAAAGLAGLARRDLPERRWLAWCVGLVALLALAGYYGPGGSPVSARTDALLDGVLAPLRSTYKLEPVIAVALALGCAHLLHRCWRMRIRFGPASTVTARLITAPVVAVLLAGLALPQLTGQSLQPGSFASVPGYWSQAAAWLARNSPRDTALVLPANAHGQFTWGDTIDDPLEPLATSPWTERGLVPFGGAGSQIVLNTAEQAVESGQDVPGLAAYLARAGIRYVVVRNDTSRASNGYVPPQVVNETLAQSGFHRIAAFGPPVAAGSGFPNLAGQEPGFALSYPAVEIFAADAASLVTSSPVTTLPVSQTVLVNGGPDSLLQLAGQGVLENTQPTVIAGQPLSVRPGQWDVTDGQPRADTDFGSTQNYQSYTYTATGTNPVDDPLGDAGGQPRQLLPVSAAGHQTVALLTGTASVTASSAGTWFGESAQYAPANAFDGNPSTAWAESDPSTPVGQWIQINFGQRRDLPSATQLQLLDDSPSRAIATQLLATSAAGRAVTQTQATGGRQRLRLPPGRTSWLRITITGATNVVAGYPGAGISNVTIPGVQVTTYLKPAQDQAGFGAAGVTYSFSQPAPAPSALAVGEQAANINRTFVTPATRLAARLTAVPTPGPALAALIARLTPATASEFRVSASSTWDNLPEFGPDNLFTRSARLPWLASISDRTPTITVRWHRRATISRLVLRAAGKAAPPGGVIISSPAGSRLTSVGPGGVVRIKPALRTDKISLTFSLPADDSASRLPGGLSSVVIPALSRLRLAAPKATAAFRLGCGGGPEVSIDGRVYRTSVTGTIGDLLRLLPVQAHVCARGAAIALTAGRHWLTAAPSGRFAVAGVTLTSRQPRGGGTSPAAAASTTGGGTAVAATAAARPAQVVTWQADNRAIRIGPGQAAYVEIHENFNLGWHARLNGKPLKAVTLDGWQQAFIVPGGAGGLIVLDYGPAGLYHAGLIASGIALLLLIVMAIGLTRRRRRRVTSDRAGARATADGGTTASAVETAGGVETTGAAGTADAVKTAGAVEKAGAVKTAGAVEKADAVKTAGTGQRHLREQERPRGIIRPEHARRAGYAGGLLAVALVIFVAGGPAVLAVPVLAVAGWRWRRSLPWIAGAAMLAAGIVTATAALPSTLGGGAFSAPAQWCALIALAAALMPAIQGPPEPGVRR